MKLTKLLIFIILPLWSLGGFAQEKLSKEEKERRKKNIQAGNPFAKYGSKAPVATLSKGKYLEVHDLDSIVTIGTSRWHVNNKKIVGDIIVDSLNIDAQPIGDAPGRWISPDPLSEEFPSWSPYNMCYNNPIKFVDPDGRAADDWRNAQGQQVYDPNANGGQGAYTKYATAQDKEFGNALKNSGERGASRFNSVVTSKTKIEVEFHTNDSNTGLGYQLGYTDIGSEGNGYTTNSDGSITVDKAKIDIYVGTANIFVKDLKDGKVDLSGSTQYQQEGAKTIMDNNLTGKDVAVATFGHEIDHTNANNAKMQIREKAGKPTTGLGSELTPQITSSTILKDIAKKKE